MAHVVMALYSYGPCGYGLCGYDLSPRRSAVGVRRKVSENRFPKIDVTPACCLHGSCERGRTTPYYPQQPPSAHHTTPAPRHLPPPEVIWDYLFSDPLLRACRRRTPTACTDRKRVAWRRVPPRDLSDATPPDPVLAPSAFAVGVRRKCSKNRLDHRFDPPPINRTCARILGRPGQASKSFATFPRWSWQTIVMALYSYGTI